MPSTFSSTLPFLIFATIVASIIFVVASIALMLDLRKMQQERKEDLSSVWYQRPKVRNSLRGVGLSLALLLLAGAFGYSLADHSPIWTWIFCLIAASLFVLGPSIALVLDLRKMQQERKKGLPSVWHRQPRTLKQSGQIAFWLGLVLLIGESASEQAQGHLDNSFPWHMIGFFASLLFILLAAALYAYASVLQKRGRHSY